MKKIIIVVFIFLIILIAGCKSSYQQEKLDEFAKCLTANGAKMYGTFWCPKCAEVKKNFGSSFKYINYVECDPRGDNEKSELCIEKGIDKYATFTFNDDLNKENWLVGVPTFNELSEKSGCPLPT